MIGYNKDNHMVANGLEKMAERLKDVIFGEIKRDFEFFIKLQ